MDTRESTEPPTLSTRHNQSVIGIAPAVRPVSSALQINLSEANHLLQVDEVSAVKSMRAHLPANLTDIIRKQLSSLFVAVGNEPGKAALENGNVTLLHVVDIDEEKQQVILSGNVKSGRHLFWAVRDRQFAQQSMRDKLSASASQIDHPARFALLFPNISRGSEFYAGQDRDREIFTEAFPGLPTLGFYGYAEISGTPERTDLHHYSTLFAIFW
jgi:small ligand-binding sensory domain FIST